jgi:hypothetical protein
MLYRVTALLNCYVILNLVQDLARRGQVLRVTSQHNYLRVLVLQEYTE